MITETMISADDARTAATNFRESTAKVEKIESSIRIKNSETAAKHEKDLNEARELQAESVEVLEQYAKQEQETLFDSGKRSVDFAGLKIGFRKSTAKLILSGKKDWKAVLQYLNSSPELKAGYVEVKNVIDKKNLIKADPKVLRKIGVSVDQKDTFFVKL